MQDNNTQTKPSFCEQEAARRAAAEQTAKQGPAR